VSVEMVHENGDVCNVANVCWKESSKLTDRPLRTPVFRIW